MRSFSVAAMILLTCNLPANAAPPTKVVAAVAKPAWGWMFGTAKAATKVKPTNPGTVAKPRNMVPEKTNLDHFKEATKPVRDRNFREQVKCIVGQKRLADGVIIKHCDSPEEYRRKQRSH